MTDENTGDNNNGQDDFEKKMERFRSARQELATTAVGIDTKPLEAGLELGSKGDGERRGEVSAATIGRMLGLMTASDFSLLDSKLDLLVTRVNNLVAKVEKLQGVVQMLPGGSDIERLEVLIGSLKNALLASRGTAAENIDSELEGEQADKSQRLREGIVTNTRIPGSRYSARRKEED